MKSSVTPVFGAISHRNVLFVDFCCFFHVLALFDLNLYLVDPAPNFEHRPSSL